MPVQILLAVAGLALLTVAADHLVLGSSRLARRLRISPVVVGVVVIGFGTSAPELLVSGVAAARGDTGIAVGNIVGSNILNLTLILGVAALIAPVAVTSEVLRREVPLAVGAVAAFALLAWAGLGWVTGTVLAAATLGALALLVRWARQTPGNQELAADVAEFTEAPAALDVPTPPRRLPEWFEPVRAVVGLAGVLAGAQLLVANASAIAADLGVSQVLIGFTVVAVGTSLPELVTAVQAQRHDESELLVGNLFGSNLFNSLAAGSVVGFASGAAESATVGVSLLVAMLLIGGFAWALLRRGLTLTRVEGAVLLGAYALTLPMLLSG
ncbi:calcium/sodium antiporter [Phytohabitans sp. ZYX-F-186]|uniref:Calcium/sodium antiporter n=1 Tax=Phytohabitans maris TaxID=3071409 RepID=A0ABU0ZNB3_9ACTN|nr:calcium/sodium antiporter [Phytohabitans sp. ZYX-F-186]MDQ7908524.1 calcium/sodium antiporter [Phytohabitans sp. ZYX-F-186]